MSESRKRARRIALAAALGLLLATAVATVVAASGVLAARPGDWTVPLALTRRHAIELNVPGLLRLATTPLALRALDGLEKSASFGRLRFARAQDALIVQCRPCRIEHARLASRALVLPSAELRLARRRGAESNRLDGDLAAGDVRVDFVATLRSHGIDVDWTLPATDLAALLRPFGDAIPEQHHARVEGTLAARGALALPALRGSAQLRWQNLAVDGLNTARYASGSFRHVCHGADGEREWIALDALGAWLPAAVLAAEDQRFYEHASIDRIELDAAPAAFDASGDALRGASTISQQLARTLFTGGERTLARKIRETLYAAEMERTLGEPRILEPYLNTVDRGTGHLRRAGGRACLLPQAAIEADPARSGLARRQPAQSARSARARIPPRRAGAGARAARAGADALAAEARTRALGARTARLRARAREGSHAGRRRARARRRARVYTAGWRKCSHALTK